MTLVRRIGAVVLLAAAVAVWFGLAPEAQEAAQELRSIERRDDGNSALADSAPQQAVVNGWTANDYLELIVELDAGEDRDERPAAMVGLCLAGICLMALTSPIRDHGDA